MGFANKVSFAIRADNGIHITVRSYEDLRDTDYDELLHFGRKATPTERKIWIEQQGGAAADKQKIEDFKYNLDMQSVPQGSLTIMETQRMIQEEIAKAAAADKAKEDEEQPTTTKKSRKQKKD